MTEVDHVHGESINKHLIVDINGSLRDGHESVLTDEVLEPEVVIVIDLCVIEWVGAGELLPWKSPIAMLRWTVHALHHVCFLSLMSEKATSMLILINKCQFRACLIK